MKPDWGDLNARARGLGTHLLHRGDLAVLAHLPDLAALAADLSRRGFPIDEQAAPSPATLDLAVRREATAHLKTLAHWSGSRSAILTVLFEDEDRRALRALIRGAIQHAPPATRLSGLLATPALPERALQELSEQPSIARIAAILSAWKSPYAPALVPHAGRPEPDLLSAEVAINRTFATRALVGARRAGKRGALVWHVRRAIDIENAYSALALSAESDATPPPDVFLSGGEAITRKLFQSAARAGSVRAAAEIISTGFADTELGPIFLSAGSANAGDLERLVLGTQIGELRRRAFRDPLGPTPVLLEALRVRAEVLDLRHLIWSISLDAPRAAAAEALVSLP